MRLPLARNEGIVVQDIEDETLAYDLVTHQACCLNRTASLVYKACGAGSSFEDLKRTHELTDEIIFLALDELKRANLLEADSPYVSPFAGVSRREVIKRVGLASMAALPMISSIVAPSAAAAQSGPPDPPQGKPLFSRCTTAGECDSGNCVSTSFLPVGSFCCPPGNGGAQLGPIGTAIGLECFDNCSTQAASVCCSGKAESTTCDTGFCASQQQFCCACV